MQNTIPTLDAVKALNSRFYAMLKPVEVEVLDFCIAQGRKFDVTVSIEKRVDAAELSAATTPLHAEEMLQKADSAVRVQLGASVGGASLTFVDLTHRKEL